MTRAGLYLVATPIGNARDITLRALDVLTAADVLVCEDTRNTLNLLKLHGITKGQRLVLAYHDHSTEAVREAILTHIREGRVVAYCSDAGTPLIADPGYKLLRDCLAQGLPVTALPGACAGIMALSLSGLPTDTFVFAGFLPNKTVARTKALQAYQAYPHTLVFYESPHRIMQTLQDVQTVLGNRDIALCRELTKLYEEARRGPVDAVLASCEQDPPRGEIVLVVAGNTQQAVTTDEDLKTVLADALVSQSLKDAVQQVATTYDLPRKRVYALALDVQKGAS